MHHETKQREYGREYDVIVVGSGLAGCMVAREMSRSGRSVLLVEAGGERAGLGRDLAALAGFSGGGYGGSAGWLDGCAVVPPVLDGLDLAAEASALRGPLGIGTLSDEGCGAAGMQLLAAAGECGCEWGKLDRFMDPRLAARAGRGQGNEVQRLARRLGDEAVAAGAELLLHTRIQRVIVSNGRVVGVAGRRLGQRFRAYAKVVVLSAGLSNAGFLRQASVARAGQSFGRDLLQVSGALCPGIDRPGRPGMAVGTLGLRDEGLMLAQLTPGRALQALLLGGDALVNRRSRPDGYLRDMLRQMVGFRATAMTAGAAAEMLGGRGYAWIVTRVPDGPCRGTRPRPGLVRGAKSAGLEKGREISARVLRHLGGQGLITTPVVATQVCATCPLGEVVDHNLETEIRNLYCCDASVLPAAPGVPAAWTVASLGLRLAAHLDGIRLLASESQDSGAAQKVA